MKKCKLHPVQAAAAGGGSRRQRVGHLIGSPPMRAVSANRGMSGVRVRGPPACSASAPHLLWTRTTRSAAKSTHRQDGGARMLYKQ